MSGNTVITTHTYWDCPNPRVCRECIIPVPKVEPPAPFNKRPTWSCRGCTGSYYEHEMITCIECPSYCKNTYGCVFCKHCILPGLLCEDHYIV